MGFGCQKRTFCAAKKMSLFDHLVGAGEQSRRQGKSKCFGGLEINDKLILRRRLHWHVGGFFTPEDSVNVAGSALVQIDSIGSVG